MMALGHRTLVAGGGHPSGRPRIATPGTTSASTVRAAWQALFGAVEDRNIDMDNLRAPVRVIEMEQALRRRLLHPLSYGD